MADTTEKKKKKDKKTKTGVNSTETASPMPPYEPPEGFTLLEGSSDVPHFDWDTINDDPNLEIWAIRLPTGLKPKYLDSMTLPFPEDGLSNEPIARITAGKKQRQYDVKIVPENTGDTGGEEMKGMTCLLPRKAKDGKLFIAPKPIKGHILFSESITTSISPDMHSPTTSPNSVPLPLPSSARYSHPTNLLKHRYKPTSIPRAERPRLDTVMVDSTRVVETPNPSGDIPESPKRHKKRKKDGDGGRLSSKKQKHDLDTSI